MNKYGVYGVDDKNPLLCEVDADYFVSIDGWIEFHSNEGDVLAIVRESLVGFIIYLGEA